MEDEIGLDGLLDIIIRDKGGSKEDYNKLMDYIAYHETGPVDPSHPDQRMKTDAKQWRFVDGKWTQDGTGKGLFMFESHEGAGGNTASNRLANILEAEGIEKPQWLVDIWAGKKSVDASKLTADQQKMLFLAYHREHETSNFSELWDGTKDKATWWADYHWSGAEDLYKGQITKFNKSMISKDAFDAEQKSKKEKEENLKLQKEIKKNSAPFLSNPNRNIEQRKESFWEKMSSILDRTMKGKGFNYDDGGKVDESLSEDPEMLFKDKYNTKLTSEEKKEFNAWVKKESAIQGRDIMMDIGAYDVQGFWKSGDYKNIWHRLL